MSPAICYILLISFTEALKCSSAHEAHFDDFDKFKMVGESSFFESKIWTEYSKLLAIDAKDAFCEGTGDIIFPDSDSKYLYYRCQNGRKELYQCIEGFEFDSKRLRCTPENVHADANPESNDCLHQMDGLYPDYLSSCQDYYRCKNGVKVSKHSCPLHQSFNFHLQVCQLKAEVTCVRSNCHFDNDGFFVYPGSKCQAYYYCRRGIRSDFICPRGSIFNKQSKSCVDGGICYEPVCTGRINGVYPDTTHDCERSFRCTGGALEEIDHCPSGQKHNDYTCAPPPFQNCEKPEKTAAVFFFRANDECKTLQDGSHIVPGTDCRNVRVCLGGKTVSAFECAKDQRYNGNSCLPKNVVPCDDACSMKDDGYYADEFTDCQGYYSCLNEKVSRRRQCPKGTAFNGHACVPNYLVSCPKNSGSPMGRCLGLRDGFHPDYLNNCRNYFYCYNHEMVLSGSCSNGTFWNGKHCVQESESVCGEFKELEECAGLSPGLYQNKTSGCTKYFYCNSGSGTTLVCPRGQIFNGNKCVNEEEYTCLSSDECVNQVDGYRQDKTTACRSYYFCSNGNKITYVCPHNLIFNGSSCISPDTYQCPFSSSKDCTGKSDGYHADKSSDCKNYFYCYKGEKLTTLTCGGKKIFDGQGCVLAADPKSVCLESEHNTCRQKKDGVHVDPKSSCQKYFTCKDRMLVDEYWCPKGSGFNGSTCTKDFSCPSKLHNTVCQENKIGFYQDLMSNCKNYYFCLGKVMTLVSCPDGTIFNGQLCIDSNYYTCPSEKS